MVLGADVNIIENIHKFVMKRFLGITFWSPNTLVYSQYGRYPLYICTYTRCIRYWLRITHLPLNFLPRKELVMLEKFLQNNKTTWLNHIMITL